MKEKEKFLGVNLPEDLTTKFKLKCIKNSLTQKEVITKLIEKFVNNEIILNKEENIEKIF